jgi:hypothetical protein
MGLSTAAGSDLDGPSSEEERTFDMAAPDAVSSLVRRTARIRAPQPRREGWLPRRKRGLLPVRFHHGTFRVEGQRVRLPVAKGHPSCGCG